MGHGSILTLIKIDINFFSKVQNCLLFHTTVTLNESQAYSNWYSLVSNWYQTMRLNSVYHHTKFKINWSINIPIQAHDVKGFFFSKTPQ